MGVKLMVFHEVKKSYRLVDRLLMVFSYRCFLEA